MFDEIDRSGSIHSQSNLWDPLGSLKAEMEDKVSHGGQYNPDGSVSQGGPSSASGSITGNSGSASGSSTSIYSHDIVL